MAPSPRNIAFSAFWGQQDEEQQEGRPEGREAGRLALDHQEVDQHDDRQQVIEARLVDPRDGGQLDHLGIRVVGFQVGHLRGDPDKAHVDQPDQQRQHPGGALGHQCDDPAHGILRGIAERREAHEE
jgi:hypothetical protein